LYFVEYQAGTVNKDGIAAEDKKVESAASSVQKMLIESMLKSINMVLREQSGNQQSNGQYHLHSATVLCQGI